MRLFQQITIILCHHIHRAIIFFTLTLNYLFFRQMSHPRLAQLFARKEQLVEHSTVVSAISKSFESHRIVTCSIQVAGKLFASSIFSFHGLPMILFLLCHSLSWICYKFLYIILCTNTLS